jgi:hypothetical protein
VSIKVDEHANDSCIELKKTGTTWDNETRKRSSGSQFGDKVSLE